MKYEKRNHGLFLHSYAFGFKNVITDRPFFKTIVAEEADVVLLYISEWEEKIRYGVKVKWIISQ